MDEQRQQAYIELVQALLDCEDGTETEILEAHPELVDEGLVEVLYGVARMMTEQNDPAAANTIEWLTNFASQLAQWLGLQSEANSADGKFQLNFLMSVFQAIAQSSGNPQVVYPLFQDRLPLLSEQLIVVLRVWHQAKFAEVDEDGKQFIATVTVTFANLIQQFPLGSRLANLEIAIACYQLALEVRTRETYPEQWATTQMNLAVAYSDRIRGKRAANLEESIFCYQLALEVYTRAAYPEDWARTQMNLGVAYSDRIRGERAANLEESIFCYRLALEVYTRAAYPEDWARTQMNLAIAYNNRLRGERAANLEESIFCYRLALEVRTRATYPEQWATTQVNLAIAYSDRIRGERAANLEESIKCYRLALEVYIREAYPEQWAMTQMNLATAYSDRIRGERAANLEESIKCYRLALEVRTREAYPEDWARTQMNLANSYRYRIRGERAANLEESIEYYRLALEVYTRGAYPEQWATTQSNLGNIYADIDRVDEAIHCFQSALEIRTPEGYPIDCLTTARNLGNLAFGQGEWQLAIDSYNLAIQAVETSRTWATDDENRQRIIREALSVYENVIQSCINIGRIDRAIEYGERARSRQLVDLIATADFYKGGEIPAEVKTYLTEYETLERKIDRLRNNQYTDKPESQRQPTANRNHAALAADTAEIRQLEAEKQTIWGKIRALDPILAGQRQVLDIDFPIIQSLIRNPHTAILSFYTTDNDTHIFIVRQDGEPQIHTCVGQGWQTFQMWLQERWLIPYAGNRDDWISTFPTVLIEIAQRIQIDNLVTKLTDISELIIIPHLLLHQIPFAALPVSVETGDELLSDRFTIHYAPSCQILKYCQDRPIVDRVQYGIVENTNGTLPGAIFECQEISTMLNIPGEYRLEGRKQSTLANFQALLDNALVSDLHLAHHAISRFDNPLESALILADGNISLAQLMMSRFPRLDEVFLSCCETALGNITITDDLLTLATGFLCAGARTVIGTLWSVSDLATPLLAIFYYEGRQAGNGRADSLNQAQIRLRQLTGKEFEDNHRDYLEESLNAYIRVNGADRNKLKQQFNRGEFSRETLDRESERLTQARTLAINFIDQLDRYCQADRPFAHPYYWAAFTCQGLA